MNEDMLDKMLKEAYSKDICPSDELVSRTKMSIRKVGAAEHAITLSLLFGIFEMAALGYFLLFSIHNLFTKIMVCSGVLTFFNIIILIICLYREQLKDYFKKLEEC